MPRPAAFPADELFRAYPELRARVDGLCERSPWCVTGVSALLTDERHLYLEIVKPRYWVRRPDGGTTVGLGAIGGSLEAGETVLAGLRREALEEVGSGVLVSSALSTHLVYEGTPVSPIGLPPRDYPRPALLTISQNIHRRRTLEHFPTLAIVTFWAHPDGPLHLGDIYGVLAVPREALGHLLSQDEMALSAAREMHGVRLVVRRALPAGCILAPTWTVRSLRDLARAGMLRDIVWTVPAERP